MSGRGSRRRAARLLCAAAAVALAARPDARADRARRRHRRRPMPAELDPSAPLAPMPDLGVDWPDLNATDSDAAARRDPGCGRQEAGRPCDDATGDIRYTVAGRGPRRRSAMPRICSTRSASSRRSRPSARTRPTRRRSAAARAPTPTCWPSCCAARAIMMRRSSRGPRRAGDALARRPDRRSGPAISLRLGRAARARRGRAGRGEAARRLRASRRAIRSSPRTSSPAGSR